MNLFVISLVFRFFKKSLHVLFIEYVLMSVLNMLNVGVKTKQMREPISVFFPGCSVFFLNIVKVTVGFIANEKTNNDKEASEFYQNYIFSSKYIP